MGNKNNVSASETKKGGGFKTFLSVIFFILLLASALILSVSISMQNKSSDITGAYSDILGSGFTDFLKGQLCFWCAFSAVVLFFGLWICTTRRFASALRGLGIACTIAPMAVLLGELVTMLMVCAFKFDNAMTPFADSLPSQFAETSGKNVIFMLSGAIIASVGIFICRIKKMPRTISPKNSVSENKPIEAAAVSEPVPSPEPVAAGIFVQEAAQSEPVHNIKDINIDVSGKTSSENENNNNPTTAFDDEKSLTESLAGVCHMCGAKNEPDVRFCGSCGAKLI